jgi:hypothetical protein
MEEPTITVNSPNGGEIWYTGDNKNIIWSYQYVTGDVKIDISRDGGSSWSLITGSTPNNGSYNWTVTSPASTQCRIRVTSLSYPSVSDMSNANFIIAGPALPPCPAEITTNNSSNLKVLKNYRDKILTQSESGREYIKLYYQHAPEVTSLLIEHSELRKEAKEILNYIIPKITHILKGKKAELLDSKLKNEIINFLNQVQEKGSPELEATIEKLMYDIENGRYIEKK